MRFEQETSGNGGLQALEKKCFFAEENDFFKPV